MSQSDLPSVGVGQAIYTWSRSRLDRTKGMGFCVASPGLKADINWLAKLNPPQFLLFLDDPKTNPDLYNARAGFSEVGRTVLDDKAIAYRKTADGSSDDTNRPQLVVHALIGTPAALGLSKISQIRDDIWIRAVDSSAIGKLDLADRDLADVLTSTGPPAEHVCPNHHRSALRLLHSVAETAPDGDVVVKLPGKGDLGPVFLAFPAEVADGFLLDPYVAIAGVTRNLTLRASGSPLSGQLAVAASAEASNGKCPLKLAVQQAADQFLYRAEPSFPRYAKAVLAKAEVTRPAHRSEPAGSAKPSGDREPAVPLGIHSEAATDFHPVIQLLDQVRSGAAALTEQENKALLNMMGPSHTADLLTLDNAALTEIFANVSGKDLIWKWRGVYKDEPADTFTVLWNRTHVAAFLGIVLVKNLAARDGTVKINSNRGVSPDATVAVLQSMRQYRYGNRALASLLERGYSDAAATRQFIADAFEQDPWYLFDAVLPNVTMPVMHMIDYLRSGFEQWWRHRRLPEQEAVALKAVLLPTFLDRVKVIFKR